MKNFCTREELVLPADRCTPPLPALGEDFVRMASTQIRIVDFKLDDHPDSGGATSIQPNNRDQAGNIDATTDRDRFELVTGNATSVIVRVTGMAFGLNPHLDIYDDSNQLLLSLTMADQGSAGYFSGYIDTSAYVGTGQGLLLEVTGASGTTGGYLISAGTQVASDEPVGLPVAVPVPVWALAAGAALLLGAMVRVSLRHGAAQGSAAG